MKKPQYEVAVIGAGPGGIAAAHLLQQRGITDFVILERADDVGGTWRDNHYPGLECDIPSVFYQFSFAPNPDWSRLFARGPEIYAYLQNTARRLGIFAHLRTNAAVTRQVWDDGDALWHVEIEGQQSITVKYLISAVGGYINAKPDVDIEGVDDYRGVIARPNAWPDTYDVTGKRVAIIGTGSSGVQIAGALSSTAASVDVYQRTAAWILPKPDFDVPARLRRLLGRSRVVAAVNGTTRLGMDAVLNLPVSYFFPRWSDGALIATMRLVDEVLRAAYRGLIGVVVKDAATRRALAPGGAFLAKRPILSSHFLSAFNTPTTDLITTPIRRITARGIETVDGVERAVDLLVLATGYELFTDPETYRVGTIMGRNGFDLAEDYHRNGLRAYAGSCHPELPNRWELVGPYAYAGFAWFDFVETAAVHAVRLIDEARSRGARSVAVSRSAFDEWNERMVRRGRPEHLYITACRPGLKSYFINSQGETVYHRPQLIAAARHFSRHSCLSHYAFSDAASEPAVDKQKEAIS